MFWLKHWLRHKSKRMIMLMMKNKIYIAKRKCNVCIEIWILILSSAYSLVIEVSKLVFVHFSPVIAKVLWNAKFNFLKMLMAQYVFWHGRQFLSKERAIFLKKNPQNFKRLRAFGVKISVLFTIKQIPAFQFMKNIPFHRLNIPIKVFHITMMKCD